MLELFADFRVEALTLPVDREAFLKRARKRIIQSCTVEERLEGLSAEQIMESFSAETRLRLLAREPPLRAVLCLRILERLDRLGAIHMMTSDMRKKLLSLCDDPSDAQM